MVQKILMLDKKEYCFGNFNHFQECHKGGGALCLFGGGLFFI